MKPGCMIQGKLLRTNSRNNGMQKQDGLALLILVITIALTLSAVYFSSISVSEIKVNNIEQTRAVLKQAKQALINYAITHAYGNGSGDLGEHGYLPCPDRNGAIGVEGDQDANCSNRFKNVSGYLPWRTLGIPALKDASGSCLWYAVSGNYKSEPSSKLVNEDTEGAFQIAGTGLSNVVAVVFAPGAALSGQARNFDVNTYCGGDHINIAAYLEGDGVTNNAAIIDIEDGVDTFIHASLTSAESHLSPVLYNDHLITITREEIWGAMAAYRTELNDRLTEVTESLAACLLEYLNHPDNTNHKLPWPAAFDLNGNDFRVNDDYSDDLNAATGYAGRFPLHIDDTEAALATAVKNSYLDTDIVGDPGDTICSATNIFISALTTIDLTDETGEHRNLLYNWKDHFFYALSKDYALPDIGISSCAGDCVSIAGTNYAAIIFFSGAPLGPGQPRSVVPGDKINIFNYLENNNAGDFPDVGGNGVYETTNPLTSNDIMFCIEDAAAPTVVSC